MQPRQRDSLVLLVGVAAFAAPIWISVQLAWNQSVSNEKELGLRYASDVMRRSEETAGQFYKAIQLLSHDPFPRCSPREIDLMREIDMGSGKLQMVARISGDTLECTSLGTQQPIKVGLPTLVTEHGVEERIDVNLGAKPFSGRLDLLSRNGVAVLIDTDQLIDVQTEGRKIQLALLVPSSIQHERLVESGSNFRPEWFKPVARGTALSFVDDGYVVSQIRSRTMDIAAVSVMPRNEAWQHVRHFAIIFVPIGLLCGCGLGWAVMYISRSRSSLPALLRTAARRKEFYVEYQPVAETGSRRCVAAEALVRWKLDGATISPASFIPFAEESGVITQITELVVNTVAQDLHRLLAVDPDFRVAVNLSAADLRSMNTVRLFEKLLETTGATPRNVIVEATEYSFLQAKESRKVIEGIHNLGMRVAIDDFGTGYSSLSCLQTLDIDVLKIDKTFVDTIGTDGATSHVVSHIIAMGHSLNMRMVAEGVETETQAQFLYEAGVQLAQGWLFGKPAGIESLCRRLRDQETVHQEVAAT